MIPTKLSDDAIVEALCQVQFSSSELPEVLVGRLSDFPNEAYQITRLATADIPAPIRRADAGLSLQPLIELRDSTGRLIRIGEKTISAHVTGVHSYPGWPVFKPHLDSLINQLFAKAKDVEISAIGLRYINAIVPSRHHINSVQDLSLELIVGDDRFDGPMNVNFRESPRATHDVTTRIAHPLFVQGQLPAGTVAIIDVEVSTVAGYKTKSQTDVLEWLEAAHGLEKTAFFKLLPSSVIKELTKET